MGRGEQYLPAMVFFLILDPTDMIIAGKLLIVVVWCGAAFSKIGKHFESVIPPMVSNTPKDTAGDEGLQLPCLSQRPEAIPTGVVHGSRDGHDSWSS